MQTAQLLDFSLFRHSPGDLKKIIYNNQAWLLQSSIVANSNIGHRNQLAFFEDYASHIQPKLENQAYHFIHILSPHPPFVSNLACEGQKHLEQNFENYKVQARCVLSLVSTFLKQLKNIGLFDSSLIIIHADHGFQYPVKIVTGTRRGLPESVGPVKEITPRASLVGRATALLAIKFPNNNNNMQLSSLPTSTLDISSTILAFSGTTSTLGRNNLFMPETGDFGPRKYGGYIINTPATATTSWYISPPEKKKTLTHNYTFGDVIDFSGLGNAEQYSVKGWSWASVDATWTKKRLAILKIPLSTAVNNDLEIISNISISGRKQAVSVTVNGKLYYQGNLTGKGFNQWKIRLPKNALLGSTELIIEFGLKDAKSAYELGTGLGRRALGLRFKSIQIIEKK